jgi:hypothetical protein
MKIIAKSNHDKETVSDIVIATNVTQYYGDIIVEYLNSILCRNDYDPFFYLLVKDNHKLYKWEP